jgi:hypothetical protein
MTAPRGKTVEGETLEDLLDRMLEAHRGRRVAVGDVLDALASRSTGVLMAGLGLVALIPVIGAVPGVSIAVAVLVLATLAQDAAGRRRGGGFWLPGFLRRREADYDRFRSGVERLRPTARRIDRRLRPRLTVLTTGGPAQAALGLAAALLALSMIPLALVPWGVAAPSAGLVALGLAMTTRDGAPALIGYALAAVTLGVMLFAL